MEEDKEALQRFFKDWSATAEQTVREIRSFAEKLLQLRSEDAHAPTMAR